MTANPIRKELAKYIVPLIIKIFNFPFQLLIFLVPLGEPILYHKITRIRRHLIAQSACNAQFYIIQNANIEARSSVIEERCVKKVRDFLEGGWLVRQAANHARP